MLRRAGAASIGGLLVLAGPAAHAQTDLSTWGSAMIQSGQATTMAYFNSQGNRDRRPRASANRTARLARACANLGNFRAQYGAGNSKVQTLTRLCRNAGHYGDSITDSITVTVH